MLYSRGPDNDDRTVSSPVFHTVFTQAGSSLDLYLTDSAFFLVALAKVLGIRTGPI
jgi:hypothetical protein